MLKQLASFIAGFVAALSFAAAAGTYTITTTAGEDTRIAVAFGTYLHLGQNATAPQVRAWISQQVTNVVIQQEALAAQAALVPATPIAPQ